MNKLKILALGIMSLAVSGCGQTVIETLNNPLGANTNGPGYGRSIVVMPFADYSKGNMESAQRRSMMVSEAFTDSLNGYGFSMPVEEDVYAWLVKENVIQLADYNAANTTSLDDEIANPDWTDTMRKQLTIYRTKVQTDVASAKAASPGVHALTQQKVAQIGRHFKADYIVRGRILEFKTRDEASWEPWKKGILPFIYQGSNRILNGFASSDAYDARNEGLTGALFGGIIAHQNATWPFDDGDSFLGMVDGSADTITWMGIGYGVGSEVAHNTGVDQAVVQFRVWVQDADTGNVVWTNRIRVQVAPETVMADKQYDNLFNKAIQKGVNSLMYNFVSYGM
ncbi:hypothetical protein JWG39_07535 [Desulforhopalus vacuolatus]|uniref:hypothetical protein n=1 Tax=Desulforhopalus vacuolatus TaxID=40414 RepID=UPI0019648241|nr:hypothetical protein [Desulforhopalus vacuolatus]MBM9519672.1 hypothetical protein [Desulforhopalus vacuolatus]